MKHRFLQNKNGLTKRALDGWDSAAFSGFFYTRTESCSQSFIHARPRPPLTHSVGQFLAKSKVLMSKRKSYVIAGENFPTQSALRERIQEILYRYQVGQQLLKNDFLFMLEVLKNHPDYELKNGTGIKAIFVRQNPVYKQTRGFWLVRLDGKETDFSYLECLKGTSHEKKFINACRVAVEPYTQEYKRKFFNGLNGEIYTCPYTNEPLNFIGSHVDHKAPDTFQHLVKDFVKENVIDISHVQIISAAGDNLLQDTFKDKKLEQAWIDFHNSRAKLQIISKEANLSFTKT